MEMLNIEEQQLVWPAIMTSAAIAFCTVTFFQNIIHVWAEEYHQEDDYFNAEFIAGVFRTLYFLLVFTGCMLVQIFVWILFIFIF